MAYLKSTYPSFLGCISQLGILVPQPGIRPAPQWKPRILILWKFPLSLFKVYIYIHLFWLLGLPLLCPGFLQLRRQAVRQLQCPGLSHLLVSLVAGHGLSACWKFSTVARSWAPEHGLSSCSAACRIFHNRI